MRNLSIIYFFIFWGTLCAQEVDLNNYKPLKSSGKMPEAITKHFLDVFEESKDHYSTEGLKTKEMDQLALNSSYYLNKIFKSGKILFGDPLSNYVSKTAENLLESHPELKGQYQFYVLSTPIVNAYAIEPGTIIITTGLLAEIQNEAELAYVISHELIHLIKKHSISLYLTKKDKLGTNTTKDTNTKETDILRYHNRSKEHESEADKLGVEMFLSKSNYDINIINGIFDVLQFGHLPLDEIPGFFSLFETDSFRFPSSYYLEKVKKISLDDSYDDTYSTHPNIKSRREYMHDFIKQFDKNNRQRFIQPNELFFQMRDLARFECINAQLISHDYTTAAYNAFIMLQDYPHNVFLEKAIVSSLYGIAKYDLKGYRNKVVKSHVNIEGQLQFVNHFFRKITRNELLIFALRQAWDLYQKQPDNVYLKDVCMDLIAEAKEIKISSDDFYYNQSSDIDSISSTDTTIIEDSKYGRIRASVQTQVVKSKKNEYIAYAFYDVVNADSLKYYLDMNKRGQVLDVQKKMQKKKKGTKPLHIKDVIVFEPSYYKIDQRKDHALQIMNSNIKEQEIIKHIKSITDKAGLKTSIILGSEFSHGDVNYYNDYCALANWTDEFFSFQANVSMVFHQSQYMDDFKKSYDSEYLNIIYFITVLDRKKTHQYINSLVYSIPVITLPFTVLKIIKPNYASAYMFLTINLNTGNTVYSDVNYFKNDTKEAFIKSRLYNSFNNIK